MNIAVDIDDTLTNSFEYFMPFVAEYFGADYEELKRKNMSYNNLPEEWKDQEYAFGRKYYDSTVAATPFKADAAWGVQKLKEMGHRIVIITGRTTDFYTDPYKTTIEELENGKIVYDKLICTLEKGKACVDENIDILVDDVPANCEAAAKVGVKPIVFNSIANQNIKTDFPRASSWKDVINMIAENSLEKE